MNSRIPLFLLIGMSALTIVGGCSATTPQGNVDEPEPPLDSLVSAEWLAKHLGDPDLVVIDTTVVVKPDGAGGFQSESGRTAYAAGHIPTAMS